MKYVKMLFVAAVALISCSAFTMKDKNQAKTVYVFGMAASFNDSIVFSTDIQPVDSVQLTKEGFLPRRADYANQMKNYLEFQQGKKDYTCMIYFSENKAKLEKEASKVKAKYKKGMVLKNLDTDTFVFKKPEE